MNFVFERTVTTLATDLDGTLIPIAETSAQRRAIEQLSRMIVEHSLKLVFVTGRSLQLTFSAIRQFSLPVPDSILCDVGSTIAHRLPDGRFETDSVYEQTLLDRMGGWTNQRIQQEIAGTIDWIELQPAEKQTRLKCSFDFPGDRFAETHAKVSQWISLRPRPLAFTISSDPDTGNGLLDILPAGINKGTAIAWWAERNAIDPGSIVFAGDSGNDSAAMTSGVRAVLVGNADQQVRRETEAAIANRGMLYLASGHGPEGVRDGLLFHLRAQDTGGSP